MYWNLTYADSDRWKEVYAISGPPLPWWKRSGSPRMRLVQGPDVIMNLVEATSDVKWANLQRTENGAIVYFRVRLEVFGVPCAGPQTSWSLEVSKNAHVLTLHPPAGPILFELSSIPSRGLLALLEKAFGPQTVSKVHA